MQFPTGVLARLWRALKTTYPEEVEFAAFQPLHWSSNDDVPPIHDELCQLAAGGLRSGAGAFGPVVELLQTAGPAAQAELIACLDLTPLARTALEHLPGWLTRMTEERSAAARLSFKDAVAIADDQGPRLIEIMFAHLAEPWMILRVMSAVILNPNERYVSGSELADFGLRLLKDIDRRIVQIKAFDYDAGAKAGLAAAEILRVAAAVASEFELSLSMVKDGPWSERLSKQKQVLASLAEGHLRKLDKIVGDALPMQPVRINGRTMRNEPRLDNPPNPVAVARAKALLSFFFGIRSAAVQGGYGTMRGKVGEDVAHRLDSYVEELLAMMHSGDVEHLDHARMFLETVADFTGMVHDEQAAQIVRRRAAAA